MTRNKASRTWVRQHVTDPYVRQARNEGYRSRAAFKLLELARRDRLLRPGMTVVDLGAAPGGWSQVAAAAVGSAGRVIAVDLAEMAPLSGVAFIRGDLREPAVLVALESMLDGDRPDLVLSDMSPNLTGVAAMDQARAVALGRAALQFAVGWLKPEGALLVKAFHGAGFEEFMREMQCSFFTVRVRKPKASRDRSSEVYLVGLRPRVRAGLAREPLAASPRCDSSG